MGTETPHVLIVDDHQHNLDILDLRLHKYGYVTTQANNGIEALEQLANQHFDLILLDIMMPKMNGYEVLNRLQADPKWRHIPVIVISAINDLDSVVKCIELGAADYLTKPFNQTLLRARTLACLEKKQLRDQEQAYVAELQIMQKIGRELNQTLNLTRSSAITLDWALRRSGMQAGFVGRYEDDRLYVVTTAGYAADSGPQEEAYLDQPMDAVELAVQNHEIKCHALELAKNEAFLPTAKMQAAIPICRDNDVMGLIYLESESEVIDDHTLSFLARLSDHAAIAMANAQLHTALQDANQAKTDFMSFIAHEVRSPMTAIKGFVDLMSRGFAGEVSEEQVHYLDTIEANINRVTSLITDLTEIAQFESGEFSLDFSPLSFASIADEVKYSYELQLAGKAQTLTLEIPDSLPPIWGDYNRQIQILTNLVSNAHKYTPNEGAIFISAKVANGSDLSDPDLKGEYLQISVQDNGLGIKEADQSSLFERFFRSTNRQVLAIQGTGLGLNITRHLIELQNGKIWFESEFQVGTTFHYVVPLAE